MGNDFVRFRLETNDNLPYNQKINIKVCVISLSSVFEEKKCSYFQTELQECFYKSDTN